MTARHARPRALVAGARARACARQATVAAVLLAAACGVGARESAGQALPEVTVKGERRDPVEKSYRRMAGGMDRFDRLRAARAPDATLRFKLLPRRRGTDLDHLVLEVVGTTFSTRVPVAADHTFVLARDAAAWREDAVVSPNRQRQSMTWRAEVRTPGWPAGTRRLGDLRVECEVGLEAGLVSESSPVGRLVDLFRSPRDYCDRADTQYLFFAERPLFGVTLVDGDRREVLSVDRLYARATEDPHLGDDLPYCDCEVLVDRTYHVPLGDHRWPDDTRVEFEYMDD